MEIGNGGFLILICAKRNNMYQTSKHPLREALKVLCKKEPPEYVKGYDIKNLTGFQVMELQDWCSINAHPEWATGLSMLEAAEMIVQSAIDNANIKKQNE